MKKNGKRLPDKKAEEVSQQKGDDVKQPVKWLTAGSLGLATICGLLINIFSTDGYHSAMVASAFVGIIAVLFAGTINWHYTHKWHFFWGTSMLALIICGWLITAKKHSVAPPSVTVTSASLTPSPPPSDTPVVKQQPTIQPSFSPVPVKNGKSPVRSASSLSTDNYLSDFRVFQEDNRRIQFDVWYMYSGAIDADDIRIDAQFLDKKGFLLRGETGCDFARVRAAKIKLMAQLDCSFTPYNNQPMESMQVKVCMRHGPISEPIACNYFPYKKTWK